MMCRECFTIVDKEWNLTAAKLSQNKGVAETWGSKSANKSPGKGAGESINPKYIEKYKKLAVIDDWRKKLSNSYIAPVIIDDLTWNSVEHFYQGSKYKKNNPDFYYLFSVNSESEISGLSST